VGAGFSLFALEAFVPRRDSAGWEGPILWDTALRDLVRQDVKSNRNTAATISDVMMTGSLVHNLLFDNLLIAWAVHGEPDVAWQMTVSGAEAYAIAFALTSWTKAAVGRQRPFQDRCEQDPGYSSSCDTPTAYRSFFSGHASTTGVGAGLLCAHHLNMPLYDGKVMDVGTCGLGIALTVATGMLRIASDKHWATDVAVGNLVGFASGYFVPTLLYYTDAEPSEAGDAAVVPAVSPDELGVRVIGLM
jgi:membrane-associated phospholipid phosphatase